MGYCPFWVLCRDREILSRQGFSSLVLRQGPRSRARNCLGTHSGHERAVGRERDSSPTRTTEPLGSLMRHSLPVSRQGSQACWVTWVVTEIFSVPIRLFWVLCRDIASVLEQGGATEEFCHDRLLKVFYRDIALVLR